MGFSQLLASGKSLVGMKEHSSPYRMRTANLLPKFESTKNPFASVTKPQANAGAATPAVVPGDAAVTSAPMETVSLFEAPQRPVSDSVPEKTVATTPVNMPPVTDLFALAAAQAVVETPKVQPVVAPIIEPVIEKISLPAKAVKAGASSEISQITSSAAKPVYTEHAVRTHPTTRVAKPPFFLPWIKKLNPLTRFASSAPAADNVKARGRAPIQTELSLERVKVVRNDLNDADLEVVPVRQAVKVEAPAAQIAPAVATTTLNRLTSRLFRTGQAQAR